MRTETFVFDCGDDVRIVAINRPGVVVMLRVHNGGLRSYLVTYWWDGERKEEWLYEREIEQVTK